MVDYQTKQVKAAGLDPTSEAGKAFLWLWASEQGESTSHFPPSHSVSHIQPIRPCCAGWPSPACCDDRIRGRNICYAHALSAALPQMIGVTHNFFQDSPGGSEQARPAYSPPTHFSYKPNKFCGRAQGGQDYGLIAGNITCVFCAV